MKRSVVSAAVAVAVSVLVLTGYKPEVFENCTAMNAKYRGGVGVPGAVDVRPGGGTAQYQPLWDRVIYEANTKSDRDKDGIACEQ